LQTDFQDLKLIGRGKVRDIYDLDNYLLIVTTDRISAFDVILPNGIPNKGKVLTKLSEFWFNLTSDIVKNHLITTDVSKMPEVCQKYKNILEGRTMLVEKAKPFPVECVVRGYISGSGWKDYQANGSVCGIELEDNLQMAAQPVSIGQGCAFTGTILHELLHVLGFFHTSSRPDRDSYVVVYTDNVATGLSIYLPVLLSACPLNCLLVCLPVCLSVCRFFNRS